MEAQDPLSGPAALESLFYVGAGLARAGTAGTAGKNRKAGERALRYLFTICKEGSQWEISSRLG